jgi:hypothetical protein
MKYFIPLVAVFAAGIVASFALASPPPGKGPNTSSSASTSTSTSTTSHGNPSTNATKCHPLNLKGTVAGSTIALTVTKAAGPKGNSLVGTTVSLAVKGKASVQAWACSAAGSTAAPQLVLRQLHVGGKPQAPTP